MELMKMMLPERCSIIAGKKARQQRKAPVRLLSRVSCHSAREISQSGAVGPMVPLLFTRISTRPNVCKVCSASWRTLSSWRISVGTARALRPSASIIARVSSKASWVREASTRCAPSLAKASAIACPMPRPPPVTTAILSCNSICYPRLSNSSTYYYEKDPLACHPERMKDRLAEQFVQRGRRSFAALRMTSGGRCVMACSLDCTIRPAPAYLVFLVKLPVIKRFQFDLKMRVQWVDVFHKVNRDDAIVVEAERFTEGILGDLEAAIQVTLEGR